MRHVFRHVGEPHIGVVVRRVLSHFEPEGDRPLVVGESDTGRWVQRKSRTELCAIGIIILLGLLNFTVSIDGIGCLAEQSVAFSVSEINGIARDVV